MSVFVLYLSDRSWQTMPKTSTLPSICSWRQPIVVAMKHPVRPIPALGERKNTNYLLSYTTSNFNSFKTFHLNIKWKYCREFISITDKLQTSVYQSKRLQSPYNFYNVNTLPEILNFNLPSPTTLYCTSVHLKSHYPACKGPLCILGHVCLTMNM